MKFSPEIKCLSNQDFSCIHLGWNMLFVGPVTPWVDSESAVDISMGGAAGIFGRRVLSRLKSYIKVYWGKSSVFLLTCTVWRVLSQQDECWKCPRAQVQITKNLTVSRVSPFVHAVIPFSRRLRTECSCVWDKENQGVGEERSGNGGRVSDGCMVVSRTSSSSL